MDGLWQEILSLGALATAIFAVHRMQSVIKSQGAKEQRTEDRLGTLESGVATNKGTVSKIFSKLDDTSESIHKIEICITRLEGNINTRLVKLETQGCAPTQKKAG